MISIEEAIKKIAANVRPLPSVETPLAEMVGRILNQNVVADLDSPPHDKSMMDGFAVRSTDINEGRTHLQVVETVVAGSTPSIPLGVGEATRIMTGAPLPKNADAVVMIELTDVNEAEDGSATVSVSLDHIEPEKHLLRKGANYTQGETLFSAGHRVRATDIGLLAEAGISQQSLSAMPSVGILPTGDELVDVTQMPEAGQIRNSNGPMLAALCRQLGCHTTTLGVGRDDEGELRTLMQTGLSHDLLLLSGGVSAGQKDLVPGVLNSLGVTEVFHKVLVKPGKPIWFGVCENSNAPSGSTLVFGLPGNPVSSLVGFAIFVKAAVNGMLGGQVIHPATIAGRLTQAHQTRGNRPTYWPGRIVEQLEMGPAIEPLRWNGSSDLKALGQADGLILFDAQGNDHPEGKAVRFLQITG